MRASPPGVPWHDRRVLLLEVVLIAVVLFAAAVLATGLSGPDREASEGSGPPPVELPAADEPMLAEQVRSVRIPVSLRGYRMRDVDALLERLAGELQERDAQLRALPPAEVTVGQADGEPGGTVTGAGADPVAAADAAPVRDPAGDAATRPGHPGAAGAASAQLRCGADEFPADVAPVAAGAAGGQDAHMAATGAARRTVVSASVDIDAPPERVFAALVDWSSQGAWMLGTRVRQTGPATGGADQGVGVTVAAFTGIGPLGFLDTMVVSEWDPPRRCAVRHTGRVVRGVGAFEVTPLPHGRSRFAMIEHLEVPGGALGALGFRLVRPLFTAGIALSLRRFARWAPRQPA